MAAAAAATANKHLKFKAQYRATNQKLNSLVYTIASYPHAASWASQHTIKSCLTAGQRDGIELFIGQSRLNEAPIARLKV